MILKVFISFVSGIASAEYLLINLDLSKYNYNLWVYRILALIIFPGLLGLLLINSKRVLSPILFGLIFLEGFILNFRSDDRIRSTYFVRFSPSIMRVYLSESPNLKGNILQAEARVLNSYGKDKKWVISSGTISLNINWDTNKSSNNGINLPEYGDILIVKGYPIKLLSNAHPAFFNYATFQNFHHKFFQLFVPAGEYKILKKNTGNPILAFLFQTSRLGVKNLKSHLSSSVSSSFLGALLLGDRNSLPQNINSIYSQTGTVHILSISGLHIGVLFGLFSWILYPVKKMGRFGPILFQVLILLILWLYNFLSGNSPPILRSSIMLSFYSLGHILKKRATTEQILINSALIQLILDPQNLVDLSFQLSYLALYSLIKYLEIIQRNFHFTKPSLKSISGLVLSSIAAQLGILPLILFYFHQYPIYFLLANLFVIPISTLVLYLGLIYFLLICLPVPEILITFAGHLIQFWIGFLNQGVFFISKLPGGLINNLFFQPHELIILFCVVIFFYQFLKSQKPLQLGFLLSLSFIFIMIRRIEQNRIEKENCLILFSDKRNYWGLLIGDHQGFLFQSTDSNFSSINQSKVTTLATYYHLREITQIPYLGNRLFFRGNQNETYFIQIQKDFTQVAKISPNSKTLLECRILASKIKFRVHNISHQIIREIKGSRKYYFYQKF